MIFLLGKMNRLYFSLGQKMYPKKDIIESFFEWISNRDVILNKVGTSNEDSRNYWIQNVLKNIPAGSRLLDAGAGECQYKKYCSNLEYVSQDFAQYDGSGNRAGLQTGKWDTSKIDIISDIINIPQQSESFDAILCTEVLEHLPQPDLALKEFARLLKPQGKLILTAPFASLTHFAPYHYSTGFNRYYYEYHFKKLGFEIEEIVENGNYYEFLAQELRRIESVGERKVKVGPSQLQKAAVEIVLDMLQKLSVENAESKDLLNFGYHIVAVKMPSSKVF